MSSIGMLHALAHSFHALKNSDNTEVFINNLTAIDGHIHELYVTELSPQAEEANIVYASLVGALHAIKGIKLPEGLDRNTVALSMVVQPEAQLVTCQSDIDTETCIEVLNRESPPEYLPNIIQSAIAFEMVLSLCVGFTDWIAEFERVLENRPLRLTESWFDGIFETGVLPPLGNKLEAMA